MECLITNKGGSQTLLRLVVAAADGDQGTAARLEVESGPTQRHLLLADVIGAAAIDRELSIYAYPQAAEGGCGCGGLLQLPGSSQGGSDKALQRRAQHLRVTCASAEAAAGMAAAIQAELRADYAQRQAASVEEEGGRRAGSKRRMLVVVNPKSGRRKAQAVYASVVAPMLRQADIEHQLLVTERMHHAREHVEKELDLDAWDGIVAVGGDGILFEVINGLYRRDPEGLSALRRMPLAVIGSGTGNGLYASVLHQSGHAMSPTNAMFLVIKGSLTPADVSLVETEGGGGGGGGGGGRQLQRHVSFLSLSWGLVADVDIESEAIRWAGAARQDIYGLWAILRSKRYRGRVSFLPCPPQERVAPSQPSSARSAQPQPAIVALPPLSAPLPADAGWVTLEDDFLLVLVSHVTHIAEKVHISPDKALGDGAFQILVLRRPVSRAHLLNLFLSLEHGGHTSSPALEVYAASAYRIEPLTAEGLYSLDGEVPEYGKLQGAVVPQALRLMGALP